MKYFLGVVVAAVIWLPLTVVGWGVATTMHSGIVYALVATALPAVSLLAVYGLARYLKWREFAQAFAITASVLVLICGMCNVVSIHDGVPPTIGR
jgi:hypothetical protein